MSVSKRDKSSLWSSYATKSNVQILECRVAGVYQGHGNGGALVEETFVVDESPPRGRQRRGVVARVEVEEEKELGDCCICLDEMNKKREVIRTPCGHAYHESCIFEWLNLHNSCPLCKRPLPLEEDSP
ncbi:E3 ubiquitin-protein ligase RNF181-like [Cucurbita maxima]|uniref:E3 ubiquitin-protein ligase RNF181-like n=1 Tax=Cucurbita maxima TaxID=3661 RepID=A0A6J1HV57_CUCMA|nr:E3 ubiquitin-protein ligase RNF181-like [Cucurbita maxima]